MASGVTKAQETKLRKVMREFKGGTLKTGGTGPTVTDPKQAIAIAYSEAKKVVKPTQTTSKIPKPSMKEDSPLNTKMKGDSAAARMKRKKQMGDSLI